MLSNICQPPKKRKSRTGRNLRKTTTGRILDAGRIRSELRANGLKKIKHVPQSVGVWCGWVRQNVRCKHYGWRGRYVDNRGMCLIRRFLTYVRTVDIFDPIGGVTEPFRRVDDGRRCCRLHKCQDYTQRQGQTDKLFVPYSMCLASTSYRRP